MNKSIITESLKDFKASPFLVIIGTFIIPIIFWGIKPDLEIKFFWVLILLILLISISYFFILIIKNLWLKNKDLKKYVQTETQILKIITDREKPIIVLNKNIHYKMDMLMSIYFLEDLEVEQFLGIGKVIHIQDSGLMQIQIIYLEEKHVILFDEKSLEKNFTLTRLKIKPYVEFNNILNILGG